MSYQDAEILRDKNGNPIPQYFNVATGKFEPITGQNGSQNTQLTGSNVVHFDLQESTGTVPAGTWKEIRTPDDGSTAFWNINAHGEFIKASFFLRRSVGKFEGLQIIWGGIDSTSGVPRSSIEMTGENGVLVVSEKIDLITNDFIIRLKAADDEDLEMRNFRIYLWKR